jgi:hypothetical protein
MPFEYDGRALPGGKMLRTLGDAGHYVTALPKAVQERPEWHTAAEMLMMAAEGKAPLRFAHIGMLKALHADKPEPPQEQDGRQRRNIGLSGKGLLARAFTDSRTASGTRYMVT